MEIILNTKFLEFQAQVWDDKMEMRISRVYFALHLRVWKKTYIVEFYRTETDPYLFFHITLPFFALNNDVKNETMSFATSPQVRLIQVTIGKIFWKSIYKIPARKVRN